MPNAWSKQIVASTETIVEAKLDMGADVAGAGLCPECRTPMVEAYAGGNKVLMCASDRIAIPCANEVGALA